MLQFFLKKYYFIFTLLFIYHHPILAKSKDHVAIAVLQNVEGSVKIETAKSSKAKHAREGILLFAGNKIFTSAKSKASVEYRDGSRVRIFENSKLTLNTSKEQSTKKRSFKYLLTLKNGSIRGRFRKGLQNTKIRTPMAIIGIKGTSFRISEKNNSSTISLTEGKLEVSNLSSQIIIHSGQWLPNFDPNTDLSQKVESLPNLISLKTNVYELDFLNEKLKQFEIIVQIQNIISEKLVRRGGFVIFESDYKKIKLPRRVSLNERGFARVLVNIEPLNSNSKEFKGLIKIRAYMDDTGFDDVAEGLLVLKFRNLGKKRTLLIHPDKGLVENIIDYK